MLDALSTRHEDVVPIRGVFDECLDERRLADSRLPRDQNQFPDALPGLAEAAGELRQLAIPADQ